MTDERRRFLAKRFRLIARLLALLLVASVVWVTHPLWSNPALMYMITGRRSQWLARAASQSNLTTPVRGKLRIKVTGVFPSAALPRFGPLSMPTASMGDFLGNQTTTFLPFASWGSPFLYDMKGRLVRSDLPPGQTMVARFPRIPRRVGGSTLLPGPGMMPGDLLNIAPVVIQHRGGDWAIRIKEDGSGLIALQFEPPRVVWETTLPEAIEPRDARLGTLESADGTPTIWILSGDGSSLFFFDSSGTLMGSTPTRSDVMISGGDFDGEPGEEILAIYRTGEALLIDVTGAQQKSWRMRLPDILPVAAMPVRLASGRPGIRLESPGMNPLFYDLDGAIADTPADEVAFAPNESDSPQIQTVSLPDGRRVALVGDNLLLIGPDGRTQDIIESMSNTFLCIGIDPATGKVTIGGISAVTGYYFLGTVQVK